MTNTVIPNSYQKPNLYCDRLAYYLTPPENVVLDKLVREILGFQSKIESRRARVSLSVFTDGKEADGKKLARGCGLGQGAVRKALEGLKEYKIIKAVGGPSFAGQMWEIEIDADKIDWEGLEARKEKQDQVAKKRTRKATKTSLNKRGHNTDIHCRDRVLERDKGLCRYCGEEATQIDHIMPLSRGGETTLANCVAACFSCNSVKGDSTPEEAGMTLLSIGTTPQSITSDVTLTSDVTPNVPCNRPKRETLETVTSDVNKETQSFETQSFETQGGKPAPDYLDHVLEHSQKPDRAGVADPSQDIEAYMQTTNEFIDVYHKLTKLWPDTQVQKPMIQEIASQPGADVALWENVIRAWVGCGWNKRNVSGMIDFYERTEIPSTNKKNGGKHASNHQSRRVQGRIPAYKVADPAAFRGELADDS